MQQLAHGTNAVAARQYANYTIVAFVSKRWLHIVDGYTDTRWDSLGVNDPVRVCGNMTVTGSTCDSHEK